MLKKSRSALSLLLLTVVVFVIGSLTGVWIERRNAEIIAATTSIGITHQYITALLHLEQNQLDRAKQMLLLGIEGEVSKLAKIDHERIDDASAELEKKSLKYYAAMRKQNPRQASVGLESFYKEIDEYVERHKGAYPTADKN